MSKYNPLADRLAAHTGDEWGASFSELEAVLGFPLPKAAQSGRAWWTNDADKSHSRAWAAQGWEVGDVDHSARRVVFRRGAVSPAALMRAASLEPLPRTEPAPASEIQPPALRKASEAASSKMHRNRALGAGAIVAAGVAAVAGLGALLLRRGKART